MNCGCSGGEPGGPEQSYDVKSERGKKESEKTARFLSCITYQEIDAICGDTEGEAEVWSSCFCLTFGFTCACLLLIWVSQKVTRVR